MADKQNKETREEGFYEEQSQEESDREIDRTFETIFKLIEEGIISATDAEVAFPQEVVDRCCKIGTE